MLQRVKEERVTVHAWLVDGEPVSYRGEHDVVAFRNTIHRETTERPANKGVIEGVLSSILGIRLNSLRSCRKNGRKRWRRVRGSPNEQAAG